MENNPYLIGKCPQCEAPLNLHEDEDATKKICTRAPCNFQKIMLKKFVKCARCEKKIHIKDFGGITKKGFFHSKCIVQELGGRNE